MSFSLRPFIKTDAESLAKYADNINVARWLTNAFPHPYSIEDARQFIAIMGNDNPSKVFAIDIDGEAAGAIGISPQSDIHAKNAELGYWLGEPFWRKGIMPEAVKEMVRYGFSTFDVERIFARPFADNGASVRVLEKVGFELEAKFEKTIFKSGEYHDELVYAIRKTWKYNLKKSG